MEVVVENKSSRTMERTENISCSSSMHPLVEVVEEEQVEDAELISLDLSAPDVARAAAIRNKPPIQILADPSKKYPRNENESFQYASKGSTLVIDVKEELRSKTNIALVSRKENNEPDLITF